MADDESHGTLLKIGLDLVEGCEEPAHKTRKAIKLGKDLGATYLLAGQRLLFVTGKSKAPLPQTKPPAVGKRGGTNPIAATGSPIAAAIDNSSF